MSTTRTTEPTVITQGERIAWTKSLADYSAALYTLEYRFRGSQIGFDVNATADGSDHACVLTAAVSLAAKPAKYTWQAWVTEIAAATNTFTVESGETTIKPGFATDTKAIIELRTPAKIMLDTLDAALLAAGSADMIEYEISTPAGSRRVKRAARTEIISLRKYYAGIVGRENAMERVRRGGPFAKTVKARLYD